jgi:hypothetical protein
MSSSVCERLGQEAGSATVDNTRAECVGVDQPKRFTTLFEPRKPGFMNVVVCSCASGKAKVFGDCASQGYLAAGIDAHRRASQSTGSMIAGGVWCGLPGEEARL